MEQIWNETVFDELKEMVYLVDNQYNLVQANRRIKQRFPEYKKNMKCYRLFYGKKEPCQNCGIPDAKEGEKTYITKILTLSEMKKDVKISFFKYKNAAQKVYYLCTAADLPNSLQASQITQNILNSIQAAAYAINPETYRLTFVNSYLNQLLPEIERGMICYKVLMNRDTPCKKCPIPSLKQTGDTRNMEIYIQKLKKYLSIAAVCVEQEEQDKAVVFTGYDVTKNIENEKRLRKIAFWDLNFNLKNQTAFMQDVEKCLEKEKTSHICIGRLKNFSNYNLILGRKAGDKFLQDIIDYYLKIYPHNSIYRIGGAKIALIAKTPLEYKKMQHLMNSPLPQKIAENNNVFQPYMEFAEIEIPTFADRSDKVLHNLEYLLSRTKPEEAKVVTFTGQDAILIERRNRIIALLKQNPKQSGFCVYYQPIYSVEEQRFSKCEALLRLYDSVLGWVSPAEFIQVAEENGKINALGQFVLEEACKFVALQKERNMPDVQVNVNVSAIQFSDDGFYDNLKFLLQKYRIAPQKIHLEITESIMINSFEDVVETMNRIIKLGVDFSLDDFGTGYSGLSYLSELPLKGIKLDKSFVDKVTKSEIQVLVVDNVIKFVKELNCKVVSEGVEEAAQFEILKQLGCDYIQGYIFSKPLPEGQFIEFVEKKQTAHSLLARC